jgi:putative transcriptional regulator
LEAIREFRRMKGWTQDDLAVEAGMSQDTISAVEAGRREPHASTLRKIARALGVEVADLYLGPVLPKAQASGALVERLRALEPAQVRRLLIGLWPEWTTSPLQTAGVIQEARAVARRLDTTPEELREVLVQVSPLEACRLLLSEKEAREAREQALELYDQALLTAAGRHELSVQEMFERREAFQVA